MCTNVGCGSSVLRVNAGTRQDKEKFEGWVYRKAIKKKYILPVFPCALPALLTATSSLTKIVAGQ
jgi:hypothetical protein